MFWNVIDTLLTYKWFLLMRQGIVRHVCYLIDMQAYIYK